MRTLDFSGSYHPIGPFVRQNSIILNLYHEANVAMGARQCASGADLPLCVTRNKCHIALFDDSLATCPPGGKMRKAFWIELVLFCLVVWDFEKSHFRVRYDENSKTYAYFGRQFSVV
jgi:hypothetical protein